VSELGKQGEIRKMAKEYIDLIEDKEARGIIFMYLPSDSKLGAVTLVAKNGLSPEEIIGAFEILKLKYFRDLVEVD